MKLKDAQTMRQSKSRMAREKTYDDIIEWESNKDFSKGVLILDKVKVEGQSGVYENDENPVHAIKRKKKRVRTLNEVRRADSGVDFPYINNPYSKEERAREKKNTGQEILRVAGDRLSKMSSSKMDSFVSEQFER